jgi:hypothetical protein
VGGCVDFSRPFIWSRVSGLLHFVTDLTKEQQVYIKFCENFGKCVMKTQAKIKQAQSIPHTAVTFYGDCVKMCKTFAPNLGDERTGCYIMTTYWLSSQLKIKLEGCHFDTIKVIEAESQVVWNSVTEHDYQNVLKKITEELEMVCTHRG